jgi:hypothetical protein
VNTTKALPFTEISLNLRRAVASARATKAAEILHGWNTKEHGDVVLTLTRLQEAAQIIDRAQKVLDLATRAAQEHDGLIGAEWVRDVLNGEQEL